MECPEVDSIEKGMRIREFHRVPFGISLVDFDGAFHALAEMGLRGIFMEDIWNVADPDPVAVVKGGAGAYQPPADILDAVRDAGFTVGLIIRGCRNIARGQHSLKTGRWIRDYPNQGRIPYLPGSTFGLVCLVEIGARVALHLVCFDEQALFEALSDNRIEGDALDVVDTGPRGLEHRVGRLDKVTLAPRKAGGINDAFFSSPARPRGLSLPRETL